MEYLINNQARGRHPGQENLDKNISPKERQIPPQKTSSFKGEKEKPQSWLQRKFSRGNGDAYDPNGIDQVVAVAAATHAITSLDDNPDVPVHKKIREGPPEPATTQIGGKREGKKAVSLLEPGESSTRRTTSFIPVATNIPEIVPADDENRDAVPVKSVRPAPPLRKTSPTSLDNQDTSTAGIDLSARGSARDIDLSARDSASYAPSTKRVPSFRQVPALPMERIPSSAERQLNTMVETVIKTKTDVLPEADLLTPKYDAEGSKFVPSARRKDDMKDAGGSKLVPSATRNAAKEIEVPKRDLPPPPEPDLPPPPILDLPPPSTVKRQCSTMPPGRDGSKAETFESAELEKIKKKYDELNIRITSWANKKKAKARRRLDNTERELERTRLKASNRYREQMNEINEIAAAARANAAERQRNEELKLKGKTNKIRTTGKVPRTCFCF